MAQSQAFSILIRCQRTNRSLLSMEVRERMICYTSFRSYLCLPTVHYRKSPVPLPGYLFWYVKDDSPGSLACQASPNRLHLRLRYHHSTLRESLPSLRKEYLWKGIGRQLILEWLGWLNLSLSPWLLIWEESTLMMMWKGRRKLKMWNWWLRWAVVLGRTLPFTSFFFIPSYEFLPFLPWITRKNRKTFYSST